MKYPKHLSEHGRIGFVAPSFGCATEPYYTAFLNSQKKFQERGHQLVFGPNCYEAKGIGISNTPKACGAELTEAYCSEDSDVLISCGGGELMCETMDYVDFEQIQKADPKWYMGFSDNTNMTFLLNTLCDTAAVYGPCAPAFGMEPWHESLEDAYALLRGRKNTIKGYECWEKESLKTEENPLEPYHVTEKRETKIYMPTENGKLKEQQSGKAELEGRLLGGCMDCLVTLLGTKYDKVTDFVEKYKDDGIIWFLEACDLNMMGIRRAMWQMKNAGWFSHVKGFLVGRPYDHGQNYLGLDQYRAVCDVVEEFGVPVIMDLDIGHLPPMMPLISGSYAKIHAVGNDFRIEMLQN